MLSPSLEDYLEEMFRLSLQEAPIRATDISRILGVSLPSVTRALRKLQAAGYIHYQRYGLITLSDKGRTLGDFLVKRNQILQAFLTQLTICGGIAAEAEAMEHYLSAGTIAAIEELVAFFKEQPACYQAFQTFRQQRRRE